MKTKKLMIEVIVVLVLLYIVLSPRISMYLYNGMLFYPDKTQSDLYKVPSVAKVNRQDVTFETSTGTKLHGWFFKNPHAKKVVIVSHGNAGNLSHRLWLAKLLLESGATVFLYDYQGYGLSEGVPSIAGIRNDGLAAYDYVAKLGYKPEEIVLFGESLGSGVACYVANHRESDGLILQSPFCSLRTIANEKLPWLQLYPDFLLQPDLDNLTVVKNHHKPLLIIHGEKDTIVPFKHAERLFSQACEPKNLLRFPLANHNDMYEADPPRFIETVKTFLDSLN